MDIYKELTPAEIVKSLTLLPSAIGSQARKVERARQEVDIAEQDLEFQKAVRYIELEGQFEKISVKDLEMRTVATESIQKSEAKRIEKIGQYKMENITLQELENKFISIRKIASIRETELKVIPE